MRGVPGVYGPDESFGVGARRRDARLEPGQSRVLAEMPQRELALSLERRWYRPQDGVRKTGGIISVIVQKRPFASTVELAGSVSAPTTRHLTEAAA